MKCTAGGRNRCGWGPRGGERWWDIREMKDLGMGDKCTEEGKMETAVK